MKCSPRGGDDKGWDLWLIPARGFSKWIARLKELEHPEVRVIRVECPDVMLLQESGKVAIRDLVSPRYDAFRGLLVDPPEPFLFGDQPDLGEPDDVLHI